MFNIIFLVNLNFLIFYAWDGVRRAVHSFARLNGLRVKLDGKHWVLY